MASHRVFQTGQRQGSGCLLPRLYFSKSQLNCNAVMQLLESTSQPFLDKTHVTWETSEMLLAGVLDILVLR
jgi:hypothetical protein